jgi:RNA-directed DNA polymerase
MLSIKDWQKHFEDYGIRPELVSLYLKYIQRMLSAHIPVIFEFQHLAALLGRTPKYLSSVVNCPEAHYRIFRIPKRKGGYRIISAPYPALLECQQWINHHILSTVPVHSSAQGFIHNRSIISNAEKHLAKHQLLKIDLADFFSSISIKRVINVFQRLGYPHNVSFYLARICCCNDMLPQGAATSPTLSNIIAKRLDLRLHGLSRRFHLEYTRYADDMVFSGNQIPENFILKVKLIIKSENFDINEKKTYLSKNPGRRIVTGLSVSNQTLKIPKSYKRKLRQEIHYILTFGYTSHSTKLKITDPFYIDSIYGKLLFWKSIEPNNSFVIKSFPKLKEIRNSLF